MLIRSILCWKNCTHTEVRVRYKTGYSSSLHMMVDNYHTGPTGVQGAFPQLGQKSQEDKRISEKNGGCCGCGSGRISAFLSKFKPVTFLSKFKPVTFLASLWYMETFPIHLMGDHKAPLINTSFILHIGITFLFNMQPNAKQQELLYTF